MYDIVPGALQRLREADIVSMAGLTVASLGLKYSREGAVYTTKRKGAWLSGVVEVPDIPSNQEVLTTNTTKEIEQAIIARYAVEVEIRDRISCSVNCTCGQSPAQSSIVCPHAAALLYYWLAHPVDFTTVPVSSSPALPSQGAIKRAPTEPASPSQGAIKRASTEPASPSQGAINGAPTGASETQQLRPIRSARPIPALHHPTLVGDTVDLLAQSGLSELRGIAREYGITTNGLSKQQLVETIVDTLKQPDAIRRVVATLDKQQRQLLAALALAGGSMNDEDLRGLFERFSLGGPGQLHSMLTILQSKAFLVRATFNSSLPQRIGLSGSSLDIGWHVPSEVRAALHVTLPITPFNVEADGHQHADSPKVQQVEPYSLLADLLLVARALDGNQFEHEESRHEGITRSGGPARTLNPLPVDGSMPISPPDSMPSTALLESLQAIVPRSLPYLRFAYRVLRLADILYKDDAGTSRLRVLPNAAELLLGPARVEVAHELFAHWLNQPTYEELFDLQEQGLRLRCRATPLNQPTLRFGELEAENKEARQALVALLAQASPGQWINFSAFARFVYRLNPVFLQKRQRQFPTPHWWIEYEDGRLLRPAQMSDWLRAEGRYLAQLIQGPLHWWGINDVVIGADERLLAFRLTPLAVSFLGGMPADSLNTQSIVPPALPIIDVTESGDLLIPCTFANWPLVELIERFAEVKGVHAVQLCYRLTPKSLGEAFSRGESPTALLELLHRAMEYQHAHAPDSPHLLAQLERRIASYGRVRLYTGASLLEAADQLVLRELNATTSLQEQVVRPIQPTLLLLKRQGIERLIEELKRRGQVPLVHESVEAHSIMPTAEE